MSVSEFNKFVSEILTVFYPNHEVLAQLYFPLLRNIVVTDSFFGSCAVFIPPTLEIDLQAICAESGYVHSCGLSVFIRKVEKARKEAFFGALDHHIETHLQKVSQVFFGSYAHEDFTAYDREQLGSLAGGLDDVKIFIEKFYMGSERLVSVLQEIREKYEGTLFVPNPGDYRKAHKQFRKRETLDRTRSLWLIVDHDIEGLGERLGSRGHNKYFICYDQLYINKNPFHLFDENKPAWIAHTTIPHTLLGAMINITMPRLAKRKLIVGDPFSGSGTTLLESLKFSFLECKPSDIEPMSQLVCSDNLEFFALSVDQLKTLLRQIHALENELTKSEDLVLLPSPTDTPIIQSYKWAAGLHREQSRDPGRLETIPFPQTLIHELESKELVDRLCYYLALRATLRNIAAFEREARDWQSAFVLETKKLAEQIRLLVNTREGEATSVRKFGRFHVFQGSYSLSCSIDPKELAKIFQNNGHHVEVKDVRQIESETFDIIVTDPPYGFNTEDDHEVLAKLYVDTLERLVDALDAKGHLVLCLPDRSYTGRMSPFFTHKEVITRQVHATAKRLGRSIADVFEPSIESIFNPPYYWESERALRRAILHFRVD